MTTIRDIILIFRQQVRLLLREPAWAVIAIIQPLLYLALFGPLLKPLSGAPGFPPGDAWQVFVPGLLVQLAMFGSLFVGFGLMAEWRYGVVERMRVTPASRMALLIGRVLRDCMALVGQAIVLMLVATIFGFRAPLWGVIVLLTIVAMLGVSLASFSYAAAIKLKSEDALAQVLNMISVPALLLSGILLPMSLAPRWLQTLAMVNPFSHVVTGARASVNPHAGAASVVVGLAASTALAIAGVAIGTRTFQRESA